MSDACVICIVWFDQFSRYRRGDDAFTFYGDCICVLGYGVYELLRTNNHINIM